jgi:integrase
MPRTRRPKPLYQRGDYSLYARAGRNLEIVWYDRERKRERCTSAGTSDPEAGRIALDRKYLEATGGEYVPPTSRVSPLVAAVIADYQLARGDQATSSNEIRHRLAHVVRYLGTLPDKSIRCDAIDERWIAKFRTWLAKQPINGNKWKAKSERTRSPATIENSVLQLAAAMRWAKQIPAFKVIPLPEVTRSPSFRANIPQLAAMFRYAVETPRRANLLAFLRLSVATWARPDAIMDASTERRRGQWQSSAKVFALNPVGRKQTKKRRPTLPVPDCIAEWLDTIQGPVVPKGLSKATWRRMEKKLGLPGDGESGMKLIRRSVATIARPIIGEVHWDSQGEAFLGHRSPSTSDIYALPDPAHLGVALKATQAIIDEIDQLAPGAFYRTFTASGDNIVALRTSKNGGN